MRDLEKSIRENVNEMLSLASDMPTRAQEALYHELWIASAMLGIAHGVIDGMLTKDEISAEQHALFKDEITDANSKLGGILEWLKNSSENKTKE